MNCSLISVRSLNSEGQWQSQSLRTQRKLGGHPLTSEKKDAEHQGRGHILCGPGCVFPHARARTHTHTHTHTHTCTLLAFPDSQVLSGLSRIFESPCQCPSYSAVRFKFSFRSSLWKKKKGSSLKRCKWLKPRIHLGLSKQPQLIF